jgi:hypothetical protein
MTATATSSTAPATGSLARMIRAELDRRRAVTEEIAREMNPAQQVLLALQNGASLEKIVTTVAEGRLLRVRTGVERNPGDPPLSDAVKGDAAATVSVGQHK